MSDTAGFDQLIMPAGHLGRATIGRNLGIRRYRAILRKLPPHRHWPRVDRAEFSRSAYTLFQRLRVGVGFCPTRLSSLASQTPPLTEVIF
jgi:hypothetical protein